MSPFNSDALRLRLTSDFRTLADGVKDASEITQILAALTQETSCILKNLATQWVAENNALRRLPDEVLALCFTFLPFKARIAASHVSRLWRTIALATPAIWSHVDLSASYKQRHELLRMALSRTGHRAVELWGSVLPELDPDGIVRQCLLEHLHHIKRIQWDLPEGSLPLTTFAPHLETIIGAYYDLDLPSDFLGGIPQRLREFRVCHVRLPEICPALSTVTSLSLEGPSTIQEATRFCRLFDLFPALDRLTIHELQEEFSHLLPSGPPSRPLQELQLTTSEIPYDLTPHYVAWCTDTIREVTIAQETSDLPLLGHLLGACTSLEVHVDHSDIETSIHATCPSGVRSVSFCGDEEDATCVPGMILRVQANSDLRGVRSVQIPISALAAFLPVFMLLPNLRRLALFFGAPQRHFTQATQRLPWEALADLPRVKELCPGLEELDFEVVRWLSDGPLTADEAAEMLVRLAVLGAGVLSCRIRIKGFSKEVVRAVDVRHVDEFDIAFE